MSALRDALVEDLTVELWRDPARASRNRHYTELAGELERRALRWVRLLRSLRRALLVADEVHAARDDRGVTLELRLGALHARRRATLSPRLLALLAEDAAARAVLDAALAAENAAPLS